MVGEIVYIYQYITEGHIFTCQLASMEVDYIYLYFSIAEVYFIYLYTDG
jgi:hypothetical protein